MAPYLSNTRGNGLSILLFHLKLWASLLRIQTRSGIVKKRVHFKNISQFVSSKAWPLFFLNYMDQKTGSMLHLEMAYPLNIPFPRGIYLTMNLWRPGWDQDG